MTENAAVSLDTLVPLRLAHHRVGIPRSTLYRWANNGTLPTRLIDGEQCARLGDMINLDMTRREPKHSTRT